MIAHSTRRPHLHALDGRPPKGDGPGGLLERLTGSTDGRGRIRCPKCRWRPGRGDRWACSKCGLGDWNTFETGGVCPVCAYRWEWTCCLACHAWSLHADWYERGGAR